MSTRLTNSHRAAIKDRLLARAFADREKALQTAAKAIAERVIISAWKGHYDTIKDLPAELFRSVITLRFRTSGRNYLYAGLDYPMPAPHAFDTNLYESQWSQYEDADEVRALLDLYDALVDERDTAKREIEALLASVTTYKRLYEIWPELGSVIPVVEPEAVGQQLAPNITNLNKALGLPAAA